MNIRVEGLDEAIAALNKLGGNWVATPLREYGRAVEAASKPYVSQPPQSKYRRTMSMYRGWYSTQSGNQVTVGNRAPYSGWVQQRDTQAWMHRQHGWHTVEDRAEASKQMLVFERAIMQQVDRIFK